MEELKQKFRKLCGRMSYYEASEGSSYNQEEKERNECNVELRKVAQELLSKGVTKQELQELSSNTLMTERIYLQ